MPNREARGGQWPRRVAAAGPAGCAGGGRPVALNVDAAANYITAAICKMTGNKPGPACSASQIMALAGKV